MERKEEPPRDSQRVRSVRREKNRDTGRTITTTGAHTRGYQTRCRNPFPRSPQPTTCLVTHHVPPQCSPHGLRVSNDINFLPATRDDEEPPPPPMPPCRESSLTYLCTAVLLQCLCLRLDGRSVVAASLRETHTPGPRPSVLRVRVELDRVEALLHGTAVRL